MKNEMYKFEYRGLALNKVPVFLKIEHDKYNPENISTELILLGNDRDFYGDFRNCLHGDKFGNLEIRGENDNDPPVTIKNIHGWSHQGKNAILYIDGYEFALSDIPIQNPEHIYVTVELTHSGILRKWGHRSLNYDGRIECNNGYPEEIEWDLDIGKGKAFSRYTYEEHSVYDNKATIQIERPSLWFEINPDSNKTIIEIKNTILEESRDFSQILSLCYRKSVSWYEIQFLILPKDRSVDAVSPRIRKKVYTNKYPDHGEELINHRDLIDGGLPLLVNNFRNSPINDALRRSISFLASSQTNQTIEVSFFQSIISLEAFCDAFFDRFQKDAKIPRGEWKKIEKNLRKSLNSLCDELRMPDHIEKVKKKLPELKNITTLDKIVHCCKALDVETNDLWQKIGFEAGLDKALNLRNHLFHRAFCENPYFLYANSVRIQVLAERLILKHLKWPDEKIWKWYDQRMRRTQLDA